MDEEKQAIRQRIESFLTDAHAWALRNDTLEMMRSGNHSLLLKADAEKEELIRKHATDERALELLTDGRPIEHVPGLEVIQQVTIRGVDSALVETLSGTDSEYTTPFEYEMRKVDGEWRISYLRHVWGRKEASVTDTEVLARLQERPLSPPPTTTLPEGLEALFEGPRIIRTQWGERETKCFTLEHQLSISSGWIACDDSSDWDKGASFFTLRVQPGAYVVHEVQCEGELIAVKIVFSPDVPVVRHVFAPRVGACGIADEADMQPLPHSHGIYARSCIGLADAVLLCSMSLYERQLIYEAAIHSCAGGDNKSRVKFHALRDGVEYAELSTSGGGGDAWWALSANDVPVALYLNTGNLTWPHVKEFSSPATVGGDAFIEHPILAELGLSMEWRTDSDNADPAIVMRPNLPDLRIHTHFAVTDAAGGIVRNFDDASGCMSAEDRTEEYFGADFQMPPGGHIHIRFETGTHWKILPPVPDTPANSPEAFERLWKACGCEAQTQANDWHKKIAHAYQSPTRDGMQYFARHYHNWRHLTACLMEFEEARVHFAGLDLLAIEMALWLHDIIYHPKVRNNEEESARAASFMLERGHAPQPFIEKVVALILATKDHPPQADPDTALLLDIDLSILGKPPEEYDAYEEAIREEYAWVPQSIFADRRHRILEKFLKRPHIYLTPYFRERYETQARTNLTRAMQRLPLLLQ